MGRRSRRRTREAEAPAAAATPATDYADADGNVLTLRDELSDATREKLAVGAETRASASEEDAWQRRQELLFERLAVRWEIAGLPLESQKELLGRYRMASAEERRWVRETIDAHLRGHMPELAG